jgi:putative DNA methylase
MKKKLIEVALPLEAINKEAAREKSIRHGHPSTLHLWWARRPLAACRAVLFASLVDDPSSNPEEFPTEADQDRERQRLFRLIEELVKWDNSDNKLVLEAAHKEILKSTGGNPPSISDPFCGGGSIPLEAQRLGLEANGSDLNPVAVLITKALIEIPPKFKDRPPVHPIEQGRLKGAGMWEGARGLADDVRYYGQWMRDRAFELIGHLYPRVKLPEEQGGTEATVVAWLWARTVLCPNPACGARMPLIRSFALSTKPGKEASAEPVVDHMTKEVAFQVITGNRKPPEGTKQRGASKCLFCGTVVKDAALRKQALDAALGDIPLAVVVEGPAGRTYLGSAAFDVPEIPHIEAAWLDQLLSDNARWFSPPGYGMPTYRSLFTPRQLVVLATFSDLVSKARDRALADGASDDYADAVATYLSFGIDKLTTTNCSICSWQTDPTRLVAAFSRQAIPMVWDYAEANPFSGAAGDYQLAVGSIAEVLERLYSGRIQGRAVQLDATSGSFDSQTMFSTDPPYYDNIGYADLSDYFYVWLRRNLSSIYPDVLSTLLAPKKQELIATPYRFDGSRERAQAFFEEGFGRAFEKMRIHQHNDFPLTVFYAFKQSESNEDESGIVASTGWETMLEGMIRSRFQVTGTWPMRTELIGALKLRIGALASSIVLACRPLPDGAVITTRKDFLSCLKSELPRALRDLQKGNIAPVDLAQAAIGPGMAVFSRYSKVLESDGSAMRVRTALGIINQTLDEVLSEQEGEFDPDTRWALAWFEQHAFEEGAYGEAEVLATAKALSVSALDETKILHSRAGKVRLLRRDELSPDWNPTTERRLTVWAVTQHLIRSLDKNGETATATLASKVGGMAETARDLAYRLYILSERKGWAEEAGLYNSLVISWPAIAPKAFALS